MPESLSEHTPLSADLHYLWDLWHDLFAGSAIPWTEIHAWERVRRVKLSDFELSALKELTAAHQQTHEHSDDK